jgi:dienelactone hydrolase
MTLTFHRRSFSQSLALGAATLTGLRPGSLAIAQDERAPLARFPRMMQEFLVEQVRAAHEQSVAAKVQLQTRAEAEQFVRLTREKIALSFGPHPEKTDLNPRVTGVVERDGYRIEKVIFESRPNFPVTANLYLPQVSGRVPGVVGTCGHSVNGKAAEAYQSFSQGLARLGYACLIYDPIGQGERIQYSDEKLHSRIGVGVREHIQAGNQQFLVGDFIGMWRAWDGIRALDYLLSRPEIDPEHIGVTGNSGGGTMTTWLCGVEDRWTMAAPACFVTTFLRNAENELPADTEQCPPRALALGLEHEDFLAAMAPKPIVILAKERDFFDVRGSEAAFDRLQHLYQLLGKPDNISLSIGPTEHGYSIENREAMYRWFNRVTGISAAQSEPKLTIEADETLWCTPRGQVAENRPATVFSFTRDKARRLKQAKPTLDAEQLRIAVRDTLRLPASLPERAPDFRILRDFGNRGFPRRSATTYAVETEPGIFAISYLLSDAQRLSRPPRGKQALLYVSHRSSDDELRSEAWLRERIESASDIPVFTCDVRGIGESLPNTCGQNSFDNPYGCDYFYAIHGLMLDRPYLGQKTLDVLRVLHWLQAFGYEQVDLIGNQWGALSATFAAVLSASLLPVDSVRSLTLNQPLKSFHSLAVDEMYDMPLAYLLPNVLSRFDLPDCYAMLADKQVSVLSGG